MTNSVIVNGSIRRRRLCDLEIGPSGSHLGITPRLIAACCDDNVARSWLSGFEGRSPVKGRAPFACLARDGNLSLLRGLIRTHHSHLGHLARRDGRTPGSPPLPRQRAWASATASAPAGKRSWLPVSWTACQIASATSLSVVVRDGLANASRIGRAKSA